MPHERRSFAAHRSHAPAPIHARTSLEARTGDDPLDAAFALTVCGARCAGNDGRHPRRERERTPTEHAAAFTVVGGTVLGQLIERDGVLSFKAQHGGVLDEEALRRGGIMFSVPIEEPVSAELLALRDLCLTKRIAPAIKRPPR